MPIERIDLFMPPISRYEVLNHFTKKLHDALMRQGVRCRLLIAERENPKPFLESIFGDPPDCTISFNGLLPDDEGRFFCDMIKIPHLACLVDSANRFTTLANSPFSIVTCPDQFACDFFKSMSFDRALFMPHAVEKELCAPLKKKNHFDVVMLSSLIDYEAIRNGWRRKYPLSLCQVMEDTAEIMLSEQNTSLIEAFIRAINSHKGTPHMIDPKTINHTEVMDEIETYIRGRDRVELVKAIKDVRIDLFGADEETARWKDYLGKQDNVVIHGPIPYEEAVDVISQSKVALSSNAWIRYGAHERVFCGTACDTLMVTAENPYLNQYYHDGEDIIFYQYGKWGDINEKVNEFVSNDAKRFEAVEKAREITKRNHTWDHRAKQLLKDLEPLLEKARQ